MKFYSLVTPGLELAALEEIKLKLGLFDKLRSENSVISFESDLSHAVEYSQKAQSVRRLIVSVAEFDSEEQLSSHLFAADSFPWKDFFSSGLSFKVEVENVQGQENRFELAKVLAGKLYSLFEQLNISPRLELKHPDFLVILFFNGERYYFGIDLCGQELNSRYYRIFPHSASFKGDLAYYLLHRSGFISSLSSEKVSNIDQVEKSDKTNKTDKIDKTNKTNKINKTNKKDNLLVGFSKDGVLAIEAALAANSLEVNPGKGFSWRKFPCFKEIVPEKRSSITSKEIISAFDEKGQNYIASQKNSRLAEAEGFLQLKKSSIEDLELNYSEKSFDLIIFQITSKDEDKINEIYRQSLPLLKAKGRLFIVSRPGWDFPLSERFKLKFHDQFSKGGNVYSLWLLEKKHLNK
jgi:23S rRNA G2445 N2-methylase RlmL